MEDFGEVGKYSILSQDNPPEDSGPSDINGDTFNEEPVFNSDRILPILAAIILLAFFIWLTYAVGLGMFEAQTAKSQLGYLCLPGQCSVDMDTGEKFCPETSDGKQPYNPLTQVCSNKYTCSNNTYRYAVLSDGSTDQFGNCEKDPTTGDSIACRCVQKPHCPRYTSSIFQTISGNPYSALTSVTQFNQTEAYFGPDTIDGPVLSSNTNSFCEIPREWLFRSTPGCGTLPPELTVFDSTKACFDSNPCLYGTPAFVTNDPESFNTNSFDVTPVGCVQGNPCQNDIINQNQFNVAIYDTNLGGIICKNLVYE